MLMWFPGTSGGITWTACGWAAKGPKIKKWNPTLPVCSQEHQRCIRSFHAMFPVENRGTPAGAARVGSTRPYFQGCANLGLVLPSTASLTPFNNPKADIRSPHLVLGLLCRIPQSYADLNFMRINTHDPLSTCYRRISKCSPKSKISDDEPEFFLS